MAAGLASLYPRCRNLDHAVAAFRCDKPKLTNQSLTALIDAVRWRTQQGTETDAERVLPADLEVRSAQSAC